jgi:uncharacterized protein YbjT (DUF2867 family)
MNLVAGATGMLGSEICRQLAEAGEPVRGLVRVSSDPAKAEKLRKLGVILVVGDLKNRSSLDHACQGVTTVISTVSSTYSRRSGDSIATVDLQGQFNLEDAAKAASVWHFIFISFPAVPEDFPLQRAKRAAERHLIESGLTYTILQPTFFTEVWLGPAGGFDPANATARIYGSGQNKISWISCRDVAAFAVDCIDHPAARNAVIRLGGPDALSPTEVVKIFEQAAGRKFTVEYVSEEKLRQQKAAARDPVQQSIAGFALYYAQGDVIDMRRTLKTFGVRLSKVEDYARRVKPPD